MSKLRKVEISHECTNDYCKQTVIQVFKNGKIARVFKNLIYGVDSNVYDKISALLFTIQLLIFFK